LKGMIVGSPNFRPSPSLGHRERYVTGKERRNRFSIE
jgi:hypothetical protein